MPASAHLEKLRALIVRAYNYWVTRSLAVGAVATSIDVLILLTCVKLLDLPTPIGAMTGVAVGSTFTFFANRYFAFRDQTPELAPQALRFAVTTGCAMLVHASIVWWLRDRMGVDVVYAKLIADVLVFSVGQLLVLRYIVFRAPKASRRPRVVS
jgi:putative flippase GtrA